MGTHVPCMEEAAPEAVVLQIGHGARGEPLVVAVVGQHVMSLQDLVQHDAVDETPEPQAEELRLP